MLRKFDFAHASLFAGMVFEYAMVVRTTRKHNRLVEEYNLLAEQFNNLNRLHGTALAQNVYLASIIDRSELDLSEYDMIALTDLLSEYREGRGA